MTARYIIIGVVAIGTAAFLGYKVHHRIQSQNSSRQNVEEGQIPSSGDLCSGTGGNGQITSIGKNTFIMKRKDDDRSQIIYLTDQKTIKISTGSGSLSNLKIGERVTLVGGPNLDGSFTATTIVVCK